MRKDARLLLTIIFFVIGLAAAVFLSTVLHILLTQGSAELRIPGIAECVGGIRSDRQHGLLFLSLLTMVVLLCIFYFMTNNKPYQSDVIQVTPHISTPVPVGQNQHGSSRWLKPEEKDKAFSSYILHKSGRAQDAQRKGKLTDNSGGPPLSHGGLVVGKADEGSHERIYFMGSDSHTLTIGATRSGKSRCLVVQTICTLALTDESILISDPKAELYHYTATFLEKQGHRVAVLDFKTPRLSDHYNLLQPIIDALAEKDLEAAEMRAWDLTNILVGKASPNGERIWHDGEMSVIAAGILCVVYDNMEKPEFQNLTNVYWFLAEMCKSIDGKMPILEYVKQLPQNHPARPLLSISDVAPARTRGSFYTAALTTLRLFTSRSIYGITSKSDFSLTELAASKMALFIILPDEKTTYYPIASLIVSQLYELLANLADKRGGRLPRRVQIILDEFGNFTPIADIANKLTVAGGRGMLFSLFVQSFNQLVDKCDENVAAIIKSNCQTWVYLQADDKNTLEEISGKLGTYTASGYQLSSNHGKFQTPSASHSISLLERKLLTPDEVARIARPHQLVTSRTYPAMMYAPDLSEWHFNNILGMGDPEHNRKLREKKENSRPVKTDMNADIRLWNVWIPYQQALEGAQKEAQKNAAFSKMRREAIHSRFNNPSED